jgi:hypothetical protein
MTQTPAGAPSAEGLRRYPDTHGFYLAPAGFFDTPATEPCTCAADCAEPCEGDTGCDCLACSVRFVVEHDARRL